MPEDGQLDDSPATKPVSVPDTRNEETIKEKKHTGSNGNELAGLRAALRLKGIEDLVQAAALALDDGVGTVLGLQRGEDGGGGVGSGGAGRDAGV